MKKLFPSMIILAFLCLSNFISAQIPNWHWAKSSVGSSGDTGFDVSSDASGNVLVTGTFTSPTLVFGTIVLTNVGLDDIFIVKYDANGNVLWAKSAGGIGEDRGHGISTDPSGNVFVTGFFYNSPTITFGSTTLTNSGLGDMFIAKYDSNGNVLWAKSAGGVAVESGTSVSSDSNGNVFVTGYFTSFTITFETTTLTKAGLSDIFIVKYDANGNVLWAKSAGGTSSETGYSIATDGSGNVFVTGIFHSPIITFDTTSLTNAGDADIYIAKYDANGNFLWANSAGGPDEEYSFKVSVDASGNAFVAGHFASPALTFGTTNFNNTGNDDIFIVKYDPSGNVLWANSAGGIGDDRANGLSTDSTGNLFVIGHFGNSVINFGNSTITNSGLADIYVAKYDSNGNSLWAKQVIGTSLEGIYGASGNSGGNVFLTGFFYSPTITFGSSTLSNTGSSDFFIAKLDTTIISGISEQTGYYIHTISPNPFTIQTTIKFREEQKNTVIKIIDVLGNVITTVNFNGKNHTLEKGTISPGIYFVQVLTENGNVDSRKIIIH